MGVARKGLVSQQDTKVSYLAKPQQLEDEWRNADNAVLEGTIKPPKPQFQGLSQELITGRTKSFIQPKLAIGKPDDRYEREADQVASNVVQKIHSPHLTNQSESIQRKQLRENASYDIESDLESSIQQTRGHGQSLDATLQATMGQAMGVDFSGVKIHTDSQSDYLNQSIQAKAFTTGQDIFFRQGAYKPSSRDGQELIAHELTHVIQQGVIPVSQQATHQNAQSEVSSINKINGQTGTQIQRDTDMDDEDWTPAAAARFMMNKQVKDDGSADLAKQNKANASIWYNTMFSGNQVEENSDQKRVLAEQQALLKRHFLAQAVFGVQGGNQFKKGTRAGKIGRRRDDTPENYQLIENFKQNNVSANLATLASGGGRFNYRSQDGSGNAFNQFLLFGNSQSLQNLDQVRANSRRPLGQMPITPMGAYQRVSTHGESFDNGHIQETDVTTGGIDSTGFDLAIGGVGQTLQDPKGRDVTTDYQGVSTATRRNPGKFSGATKEYQTGHGLHRHASQGNQTLTQIAFEGSAPLTENIHGGSHGVGATISKKILGGASEKTLTGQDKRSKLGLPGGIGGVKSDINQANLARLERYYAAMEALRNSEHRDSNEMEKTIYKRLLTATTQEEHNQILKDLLNEQEWAEY